MRQNFTKCAEIFRADTKLQERYAYTGPVGGVYSYLDPHQLPLLITNEGCRQVCGTGSDYYVWEDASATISTWILPIIGLMLQVPFESNEFISTLFFMARVVGSPIATMGYILWNIKISGKCALFVDMSTRLEEDCDLNSPYEQIRDSFYLLGVMNQYSIKHHMPRKEAEKLLRIALFSDSLQLEVVEDESRSLIKRRRKLAKTIRESRKRGVVPVFVTLMWFLFSLVVSIQAAFGQLGANATAHNMALGWLLAWLPSLVLFSVVDRNPIAADAIRAKLNKLLDATRSALLNEELRGTYIREIQGREKDFRWTERLGNEDYFQQDFFTRFAGQGRVRWHYGVAPPILAGIEMTPITDMGRGWLEDSEKARRMLVKGPEDLLGLHWLDKHCLWQVLASFLIFFASVTGAFIISYFTPTVGLGCRSGGYMVYFIVAFVNAGCEGLIWAFVREGALADKDPVTVLGQQLERRFSQAFRGSWRDRVSNKITESLQEWQHLTARDKWERLLLRPLDVAGSLWLSYIVASQVFGIYRTCDCMCSMWGFIGGYMDFESSTFYRGAGVGKYWGASTAISSLALAGAFLYATIEWGQQSHIATNNYDKAQSGLRTTRRFRKQVESIHTLLQGLRPSFLTLRGRGNGEPNTRRPLVWSSKSRRFTNSGGSYLHFRSRIPSPLRPRSRSRSTSAPTRMPRTPNIEWENTTVQAQSMSRDPSQTSTAYVPSEPSPAFGLSIPQVSHQSVRRVPYNGSSPHAYASHSPASSIVGTDMSNSSAVPMDRVRSTSSQGIERKPLLSSPDLARQRTMSRGSTDTLGGRSAMNLGLGLGMGTNSSSHLEVAVEEVDEPLRREARRPRVSFGEVEVIAGQSGEQSGSGAVGEESLRGQERDLHLGEGVPRERAY